MKQRLIPIQGRRFLRAGTVAVLLCLSACENAGNSYEPPPPPPVKVARPVVRPVTDYLELTGSASAVASVNLVARVPGYLQSVNFRDGSIVNQGDLLFVIEPETYEADVKLAKATLAQQQAQLTRNSAEYDRQLRLVKQSASSQANLEKWLADRNSAAAAVDQARANLDIAKINLGYTKVTAPFTGRIGRHLVDTGNLVGTPSPTTLATIEQIEPIDVYFNVDEPDVLRIHAMIRRRGPGPADLGRVPVYAGLQTEKGYPHEGRLDFIDTGLDPSTGTLQVRAVFPNSDHMLLPGVFVRVRVPVEQNKQALLVSNRALGVDQTGSYLLVVNADDVVEQRVVETGALVDGLRVISKGLTKSDRVVVEGLQRATPGTKVTVTLADATTTKPLPASATAPAGSEAGSAAAR
ncbi:MAG: efflux RND transporter periplasmic adaptor subunit [Gammaproteobacteria bacterium]